MALVIFDFFSAKASEKLDELRAIQWTSLLCQAPRRFKFCQKTLNPELNLLMLEEIGIGNPTRHAFRNRVYDFAQISRAESELQLSPSGHGDEPDPRMLRKFKPGAKGGEQVDGWMVGGARMQSCLVTCMNHE